MFRVEKAFSDKILSIGNGSSRKRSIYEILLRIMRLPDDTIISGVCLEKPLCGKLPPCLTVVR